MCVFEAISMDVMIAINSTRILNNTALDYTQRYNKNIICILHLHTLQFAQTTSKIQIEYEKKAQIITYVYFITAIWFWILDVDLWNSDYNYYTYIMIYGYNMFAYRGPLAIIVLAYYFLCALQRKRTICNHQRTM